MPEGVPFGWWLFGVFCGATALSLFWVWVTEGLSPRRAVMTSPPTADAVGRRTTPEH